MYKATESTFINELGPNERFSFFHFFFFFKKIFHYWFLFPSPFSFLSYLTFPFHTSVHFFISALKRIVKRVLGSEPSHCCSNHRFTEEQIEWASRSLSVHHDLSIRGWCPRGESDRTKPSPAGVCWTSNNGDYRSAQATTCSRAWQALDSERFSVCPT